MTISDALHTAETQLRKNLRLGPKEHHRPRWEAEILLAELLEKDRAWIVAHGRDVIPAKKHQTFRSWITRRKKHEPLAYILGDQEFYGRDFIVTPDTLIPRSETEMLVEMAGRTPPSPSSCLPAGTVARRGIGRDTVIWDIGTGSGALAVTLAVEHPDATVIASDISSKALAIAKRNAKKYGVAKRITFFNGSLISVAVIRYLKNRKGAGASLAPLQQKTLIITANLPYLPEKDKQKLMPDVVKFEPSSALFSGADGLDLIRAFMTHLAIAQHEWKFDHIQALFEFDPSQTKKLLKLSKQLFPDATITVYKDFAKRDRVLEILI